MSLREPIVMLGKGSVSQISKPQQRIIDVCISGLRWVDRQFRVRELTLILLGHF
jgi:hypothetical protein